MGLLSRVSQSDRDYLSTQLWWCTEKTRVCFLLQPSCWLWRPEGTIRISLSEQMSLNKDYQRTEQHDSRKEKTKKGESYMREKLFPWVRLSQKSPILYLLFLGIDGAEHNWIQLFFRVAEEQKQGTCYSWGDKPSYGLPCQNLKYCIVQGTTKLLCQVQDLQVTTDSASWHTAANWCSQTFPQRGRQKTVLCWSQELAISCPGHLTCPGHCHLYLSVLFLPTWVFSPLCLVKVNTFSTSTGNNEGQSRFGWRYPWKKDHSEVLTDCSISLFPSTCQDISGWKQLSTNKKASLILWLL